MFLGYNTNGFAHHRLEDAVEILAELGYGGVALTLDFQHLNPFESQLRKRIALCRELLDWYRLSAVVETGARFLLDPRRKHQPTLLSPDEEVEKRVRFLGSSIEVAALLGIGIVSFWSGAPSDDARPDVLMSRLVERCQQLCEV